MKKLFDCYFLIASRNKKDAIKFLDTNLPERSEVAEDYPVPMFADRPKVIYQEVAALMDFLENNDQTPYSIYWGNCDEQADLQNAMLFYTDDGKLICGVSVRGLDIVDETVNRYYKAIKEQLRSAYGCITFEEAPPENSVAFLSFCRERYQPAVMV